jgi:NTE family protein
MQSESVPKTAFVLAGGGSLGAVQVGMLAELISAGIYPDLIVGVSAGALNGAFLAFDPSSQTVERMALLWSQMSTRAVLGLSWRSLLGVVGIRDHVGSPQGLRNLLRRELGNRSFADAAVPLHIICAELVTGADVILCEGDIAEAIIASTAIPGVFPAAHHAGRFLVDGAVAESTPIAVAAGLGATRVIVLPCGFACAQKKLSRGAVGRAMHAIALLGARQLKNDFDRYASSIAMRIAPPLCPMSQSSYDYSNAAELIARARVSTRAWLDGGGLDSGEFPAQLTAHSHSRW